MRIFTTCSQSALPHKTAMPLRPSLLSGILDKHQTNRNVLNGLRSTGHHPSIAKDIHYGNYNI